MQSCNALLIATSALVGLILAPNPAYATLALGFQFLSTMVATLPASLMMKYIGRRNGFWVGSGFGIFGSVFCFLGVMYSQFMLFCLGSALLGVFNAFGHYYRFAAADASSKQYRSRAISLVLAGGLIAAFAGPNLANHTRAFVTDMPFAGCFMAIFVLYLSVAAVLVFVTIPRPSEAERQRRTRALKTLIVQPKFIVAALGAMASYGVMNLIMVATPLAMSDNGHAFTLTASVLQWHIVGMYAPAFFTGHLIHRVGILPIMTTGSLLLAAAACINLLGVGVGYFIAALVALGVGWNFLFTGSTTLLIECYRPEEKAIMQGLNDTAMFAVMALTSASSGALFHWFGWKVINLGVLPVIGIVLVVSFLPMIKGNTSRNYKSAG